MKISRSHGRKAQPLSYTVAQLLAEVSTARLREHVQAFSFPRHYEAEPKANVRARDMLITRAKAWGWHAILHGKFDNVVLTQPVLNPSEKPAILLGAHYDSVPGTPGADDNASAMAVCLECAQLLANRDVGPVVVVFFNREEDGLLGSHDFVSDLGRAVPDGVREAHVFEMVGFRSFARGSQGAPEGLPVNVPDVGDFLAILANRHSLDVAEAVVSLAPSATSELPVMALKIYLGTERLFSHLTRSDHAPFWQASIPCLMWTDTSEFRNPNYHQATDTPDTLDFEFMADIVRLVLARVSTASGS